MRSSKARSILILTLLLLLPVCTAGAQCSHNYVDAGSFLRPTCTQTGSQKKVCTLCNNTITVILPKLGHDMKVVSSKVSCTSSGTSISRCTRCNHEERTRLLPLGHDYKETYLEPATCIADGNRTLTCTRCNDVKLEVLPATGKHSWGNWVSVVQASCSVDGKLSRECKYCGEKETQVSPATGNHTWFEISRTQASCEEDEIIERKCKTCAKTQKITGVKAYGHSWKDNQVSKQPTCTEDGTANSVCSRCGKTAKNRTLPALGHQWKRTKVLEAASCTEPGKLHYTCEVCGETKTTADKAKGHDYDAWKVIKAATQNEDGLRERTCKTCGHVDTQAISAKGKQNAGRGSSSASANRETVDGIAVYTTIGKVNLRMDPSTSARRAGQVARKNTFLGELLDAQVDKKGVVWYQVEYKNKKCWVMGDYAEAIVGEIDTEVSRKPEGKTTELKGCFLKSLDRTADQLKLDANEESEAGLSEFIGDAVRISGYYFTENIFLTGKGYTVYGVKVGDKLSSAVKKLKKENLWPDAQSAQEYTFRLPCSPDSLSIDADGFTGRLVVIVDPDNKIQELRLIADIPQDW